MFSVNLVSPSTEGAFASDIVIVTQFQVMASSLVIVILSASWIYSYTEHFVLNHIKINANMYYLHCFA